MADLITNINQAISDFRAIKQAIINKGVNVPDGTPTSDYNMLISKIENSGGINMNTSIIGRIATTILIEDVLISEETEE